MELLIVIGIISILAGIVYFVYSQINDKIRLNHCLNNFKQIGLALRIYAQDYNGFAPPYTNYLIKIHEIHFYLPNADNPDLFEAAYAKYVKNKEVFFCPLDPYAGKSTPTMPDYPTNYSQALRKKLWGEMNHKATSYRIESLCAMKGFAPILVDHPPTPETVEKVTGVLRGDWRIHGKVEYASEGYHSLDYSTGAWRNPPRALYLFFDGSVRIRREP